MSTSSCWSLETITSNVWPVISIPQKYLFNGKQIFSAKTSFAAIAPLIALGKPAYALICIIISTISRGVFPTFKAALIWSLSCGIVPIAVNAATVHNSLVFKSTSWRV